MSAPGQEFKDPYRGKNFMGLHVDDAAALTYIRLMKWDSSKDGLGQPEEGMVYYDETNRRLKYYDSLAGAWVNFGEGVPQWKFDPTVQAVTGISTLVTVALGYNAKRITAGGANPSVSGIELTTVHPPTEGTELLLMIESGTQPIRLNDEDLVAGADRRLKVTSVRNIGGVFTYVEWPFADLPVFVRFTFFGSRWHATSVSKIPS